MGTLQKAGARAAARPIQVGVVGRTEPQVGDFRTPIREPRDSPSSWAEGGG
jgi:hypothetical protein